MDRVRKKAAEIFLNAFPNPVSYDDFSKQMKESFEGIGVSRIHEELKTFVFRGFIKIDNRYTTKETTDTIENTDVFSVTDEGKTGLKELFDKASAL